MSERGGTAIPKQPTHPRNLLQGFNKHLQKKKHIATQVLLKSVPSVMDTCDHKKGGLWITQISFINYFRNEPLPDYIWDLILDS